MDIVKKNTRYNLQALQHLSKFELSILQVPFFDLIFATSHLAIIFSIYVHVLSFHNNMLTQ